MSTGDGYGTDPVLVRLREYIPPPGFDTQAALTAGRRSVSRRRWTVAVAIAALVAAGGAATATTNLAATGLPDPPPGSEPSVAPPAALSVEPPRPLTRAGALTCTETPLELPAGTVRARVYDVSPDGRVVVGNASGQQQPEHTNEPSLPDFPTVWRDGRAEALDQAVTWIVVGRDGVLLGVDLAAGNAFMQRDGRVRELPTPAGYDAAVPMVIGDNGDVFGTLRRGQLFPGDGPATGFYNFFNGSTPRDLDLVVWPAASPDAPRVLDEPGQATVVGIAGPGLLFADVWPSGANQRPYVWTKRLDGAPFPLPTALSGLRLGHAAGDYLYGAAKQGSDSVLARWHLPTGRIDTFIGSDYSATAANGTGWFATWVHRGRASDYLIVAPDGTARELPGGGRVAWISPDGRTLIGESTESKPVRWQCQQ
jgi:hypothetical protein